MVRAVTLLTLDAGSVLYNPVQMPDEVVLKHTDGELVKISRSESDHWRSLRRKELEVNFWEDGEATSPVTALANLADRQAFGFRVNGEAVNPLTIGSSPGIPDTIEIEGLHLGGIVIEDQRHLPFAVFTTDEEYFRAFVSDNVEESVEMSDTVAVLERRGGSRRGMGGSSDSVPDRSRSARESDRGRIRHGRILGTRS